MSPIPQWSLDTIYKDFSSPEYISDMEKLAKKCETLTGRMVPESRGGDTESWLVEVIDEFNVIMDLYETLEAYAYARYSTNTRDEDAVRGLNLVEEISLQVQAVAVALKNSLADNVGDKLDTVLNDSQELEPYKFILQEMLTEQRHLMSPEEESLAADLGRSGGDAWGRLQEAVSSTAEAVWDEERGEKKSVIELRSLAYSSNRDIREKAYRKELEVWKRHEIPLAFALNGVKGTTISLNRRRNYKDSLEKSIHQSRITRETLDSLIFAMEESLPMFRNYLKGKAGALGLEKAAFFDIFAPLRSDAKVWGFDEAKEFIIDNFSSFHPGMGEFARDAFDASWIDALPRTGKVGGAYCTSFPLRKEARVLCNFDGSLSSVSTIAHELGHAYHSHVLRNEPALLADYPMTLAETASIFAETIIFTSALDQADAAEKPIILETFLQESMQVIVDILSRFYFEKELFAKRQEAELMPADLCGMMRDAQLKTYGDSLDKELLHPYMWAVKGHYYSTGLSFYNFPYAFGQLFGLGLYARYQEEGPGFRDTYDSILYQTGRDSAVEVTKEAGFSIESPDFWRQGISVISRFAEEFDRSLQK